MASLEQRNEIYRIVFRYQGEKFSRSLKTTSESAACLALAKVQDGLYRLGNGLLVLSPEDDIIDVLLQSGVDTKKAKTKKAKGRKKINIGRLLDRYFDSIPEGSLEPDTFGMLRTHLKHLKRILGVRSSSKTINLDKLQGYINTRSQEPGIRGRNVSAVTIRKELTTLYSAWSWAKESSIVAKVLPTKKRFRYPKLEEKPPFKTWDEITRLIDRCNLSEYEQREHWDCLFIDEVQIGEFLNDLEATNIPASTKAMIATAAYTGMRRSELLRSRLEDVDLESGKFTIREKKRIRSQHSTRSVPICSALRQYLVDWFGQHPGGPFTFTTDGNAITKDQAHKRFVKSVENTRWQVLRGWHSLRHSFISCLAAKNVDQRIIDGFVGHTTEAMRRRYRHLFPNTQHSAIDSVFG